MFQSNFRIIVLLIGVIAMWAPIHIMNKFALEEFSSQAIAFTRWTGVTILLWALMSMRWFRNLLNIKKEEFLGAKSAIWMGILFLGPAHTIGCYSYNLTSSIEASVLTTTGPVWTTLMAFFLLKEHVSKKRAYAIAMGMVGAYVITAGFGLPEFKSTSALGNSLFLVYMLLEACGLIYAKRYLSHVHGTAIVAWQALGTAISLGITSLILPNHFPIEYYGFSTMTLVAMGYLVFIAGIFCFTMWYIVAQKAPISLMAVTGGVEPVVGTFLGIAFLGEVISPQMAAGIACVAGALYMGAKADISESKDEVPAPVLEPVFLETVDHDSREDLISV